MNAVSTKAIILARTNYGESDRILTVITEQGDKVVLMAKGVRKLKSKLAGGIELFCESEIVYMGGRGRMGTLVSARVRKQYGHIVKSIDRTMYGYEILKVVGKFTEDEQLADYYSLISLMLEGLNDLELDINIIKVWTYYHLLNLTGHQPNIYTDHSGKSLEEKSNYEFKMADMTLLESPNGQFTARHIKFLRLVEKSSSPAKLFRINDADKVSSDLVALFSGMIKFVL